MSATWLEWECYMSGGSVMWPEGKMIPPLVMVSEQPLIYLYSHFILQNGCVQLLNTNNCVGIIYYYMYICLILVINKYYAIMCQFNTIDWWA